MEVRAIPDKVTQGSGANSQSVGINRQREKVVKEERSVVRCSVSLESYR